MQTIVLNVEDSFVDEFQNWIDKFKDKIQVTKDKNLEIDPYFYERQKQLQQDIEDIDRGEITMISQSEYEIQMDNFFDKLKLQYAD